MSEAPHPPPDVHPTALLLPWYVNGQLSAPERREVEEHLTGCAVCRDELESVSMLRRETRDSLKRSPGPSARVKSTVMVGVGRRAARPRFLARIWGVAGGLRRPRWAASFALLLIICQFGAIAWLTIRPGTSPELAPRSVSQAPLRLKIVFSPAANERDVHVALQELGGRIVDGPTDDGGYVVQLSGSSPQAIAAKLRALRERPGLVERIDNAAP